MINVTRTFLPSFDEYTTQLRRAWDKGWITNNGELVRELETKLSDYLGVKHLLYCGNGTLALQLAIKGLALKGEIITTPYSYVATTNAIIWEGCQPVFVDIDEKDFCIDAEKIEAAITKQTTAILATHVYGLPCDTERIAAIANKHKLRVIYDGAHAFGSKHNGQSLLSYGDIATCSFHATKLFHTVEGGCVICRDKEVYDRIFLMRSFGHSHDDYYFAGINAKNSEFHAAMGLTMLPHVKAIIDKNRLLFQRYTDRLGERGPRILEIGRKNEFNYGYFPVLCPNEEMVKKIIAGLEKEDIIPRRYFYPSLNTLPFLERKDSCPVSEGLSNRVLCLPLYPQLEVESVDRIAELVLKLVA